MPVRAFDDHLLAAVREVLVAVDHSAGLDLFRGCALAEDERGCEADRGGWPSDVTENRSGPRYGYWTATD